MEISKESAIKKLQEGIENTLFDGYFTAALIMGRDALQRNIPREVLYSADGYYDGNLVFDSASCPNCGHDFEEGDETWESKFCPNCGAPVKGFDAADPAEPTLKWEF